MPAKKRRKKPGLVWRVLFGHNGPTERRLRQSMGDLRAHIRRQLWRDEFVLAVRDPATGVVRKKRMHLDEGGRLQEVKVPPKKRTAAKKTTGRRTASKPSRPSRTSKAGSTQRQRQTVAVPQVPRRARAEPLAERVLRNPDGTLNGSRKQSAEAKVAQEYAKAAKNAATAERRAERLLGWDQA